ncbi:hypothetical protein HDU78_010689 [Chytriomyces hyalinus]|nr:hypothetical protein HDU78_010689 [Chytriomyces hyalinus]
MPHCPTVKGESRPLWSIPFSFPHTTEGKAPANSVLAYRVDLRAEQLATLITLAENVSIVQKGRPINVKSYSALGVKSPMDLKPTEEDVSLHYERTRVFFKSHILDESIAFEKLTTTSNPIVLPIEFHSHICRSSLLIQMEGRANVGSLSVYDDVKEPELNMRERTTLSKMCQVTPDECGIEVRNIDLSDTAIKHEDAEFNLTESSALVNVRKQARDLLVASFQSKTQS